MSDDPIRRAALWSAFYMEEGGLKQMLAQMHAERFMQMEKVEPENVIKLQALAMEAKIVRELENKIKSIFADGAIASDKKKRREKTESLPQYQQRGLGVKLDA